MIKSLIAFTLLICALSAIDIQVPKIQSNLEHDIKLGNREYITLPKFEFEYVYERGVQEITNDTSKEFAPCQETAPEITFSTIDTVIFEGIPRHPPIIFKFEDLKYSQFLLDVYYEFEEGIGGSVFAMFQNQILVYISLTGNKKIDDAEVYKVDGLPDNVVRLSMGYFAKIGPNLFFLNNQYAILATPDGGSLVEGYQALPYFETVIPIEDKYLGVAYRQNIVFYTYQNQKLVKEFEVDESQFKVVNQLQITDMIYYKAKNILFILDEDDGILSSTLSFDDKVSRSEFKVTISKQKCTLMELNKKTDTLHVVCDKIFEIFLNDFPKVQEKIHPHPKIKIHEIYANGPIVAFIGRSIFKMMYLGRFVNFYEGFQIDKLIFSGSNFLSANQYGLTIGTFNITPPAISCYTNDQSYLGKHQLSFTTRAECNSQFFEQNNIVKQFTSNDICKYTVYEKIYFWEPAEIFMVPILIALLILIVITLTILIIWIAKRMRLQNVTNELDRYMKIGTSSAQISNREKNDKYEKYQDEIEGESNKKGQNQSKASNLDEEEMDEKPAQIQMGNPNDFEIQ